MAVFEQEHGLLFKLLWQDAFLFGERVRAGDGEQEFIGREFGLGNERVGGGGGDDGGIEFAARGGVHEVLRDVFDDAQRGAGIRLLHGFQNGPELVGRDGGDEAECDGRGHPADFHCGVVEQLLPRLQDKACAFHQWAARGRYDHAAAGALDELHAEFGLQLLQLEAQCALADVAAHGGVAEVAELGDGDEVFKITEVHR